MTNYQATPDYSETTACFDLKETRQLEKQLKRRLSEMLVSNYESRGKMSRSDRKDYNTTAKILRKVVKSVNRPAYVSVLDLSDNMMETTYERIGMDPAHSGEYATVYTNTKTSLHSQ